MYIDENREVLTFYMIYIQYIYKTEIGRNLETMKIRLALVFNIFKFFVKLCSFLLKRKYREEELWQELSWKEENRILRLKSPFLILTVQATSRGKWEGFVVSKFKAYLILYRRVVPRKCSKLISLAKDSQASVAIYPLPSIRSSFFISPKLSVKAVAFNFSIFLWVW